MDSGEQLAIINGIDFGCRDLDVPVMWFTVRGLFGAALIVLSLEETGELIEREHIRSFRDLEGKPCVVEAKDGIVRFRHLYTIK